VINGEVSVSHYQDEDMIIMGTPEMCLEKILRYEEPGWTAALLHPVRHAATKR